MPVSRSRPDLRTAVVVGLAGAAVALGLVLGVLDALGYEVEFVPKPDDEFDLEAHLDHLGTTDDDSRW